MELFQKGFNYAQDGPGNRLVYHLAGCNMRCPWCSNPEGIYGRHETVSVRALVDEAVSCRPLFFDSGGVTFTGGEATVQFDELKEALTLLKGEGIHTAIETNATAPRLYELFSLINCLIADFKHPLDETHRRFTGVSNEAIRENLQKAAASGIDLLIRTPLINGFNADENALAGFLAFYETLDTAHTRFELLLYHEYGKDKWARLGLPYSFENGHVDESVRRRFEDAYRQHGLTVIRT